MWQEVNEVMLLSLYVLDAFIGVMRLICTHMVLMDGFIGVMSVFIYLNVLNLSIQLYLNAWNLYMLLLVNYVQFC
jgi:hypothetical protein